MYDDFLQATKNNNSEQLKKVFKHYKNDSIKVEQASDLMELAISFGYDGILKLLLKKRPDIFSARAYISRVYENYASRYVPLLITAILSEDKKCVELLVKYGANINEAPDDSFSPLGYALHLGKRDIAHYLLLKGAQLNIVDMQLLNKFNNHFLDLEDIIDIFKNTNKIKKEFSQALTNLPKHTRVGSIPIDSNVKIRKYHSFNTNRERQILRHVATQLYFSFKEPTSELVEIQAMHLICNKKEKKYRHFLFITANPFVATNKFNQINEHNFKGKLISNYSPRTTEEKVRTERYSKKIKYRIFGPKELQGEGRDLKKARYLKKLILISNIKFINLNYINKDNKVSLDEQSIKNIIQKLEHKNKVIFFVQINNCSYAKRHVEEFLCDIVEVAEKIKNFTEIESSIAGKKRPCLGCKGRMDHERITNYGKYPGLFFKHTAINQPPEIIAKTFENFNGNIYLSDVCSQSKQLPVSDFDSGSDTEEYGTEEKETSKTKYSAVIFP